jgi:hypothetical protein
MVLNIDSTRPFQAGDDPRTSIFSQWHNRVERYYLACRRTPEENNKKYIYIWLICLALYRVLTRWFFLRKLISEDIATRLIAYSTRIYRYPVGFCAFDESIDVSIPQKLDRIIVMRFKLDY